MTDNRTKIKFQISRFHAQLVHPEHAVAAAAQQAACARRASAGHPRLWVRASHHVSGSMRTLTGAEHFAAIRSYTAAATRNGLGMLDALVQAASGNPWIPATA